MSKAKKKAAAVPETPATVNAKGGGIKGWLSRNWCYLAAFVLPVALIYMSYAFFGM